MSLCHLRVVFLFLGFHSISPYSSIIFISIEIALSCGILCESKLKRLLRLLSVFNTAYFRVDSWRFYCHMLGNSPDFSELTLCNTLNYIIKSGVPD